MDIERASSQTSLMDVLDRVLDKGVVIDAWVRVSLVGIDLVTVEARVVVASIETYLYHSAALAEAKAAARPSGEGQRPMSLAESIGIAGAAAGPTSSPEQRLPRPVRPSRVQVRPRMTT